MKSALEKEMATHFSICAWKIPWMEEPGRLQSMESQSQTQLSDFTFTFKALADLTLSSHLTSYHPLAPPKAYQRPVYILPLLSLLPSRFFSQTSQETLLHSFYLLT